MPVAQRTRSHFPSLHVPLNVNSTVACDSIRTKSIDHAGRKLIKWLFDNTCHYMGTTDRVDFAGSLFIRSALPA